MKWQIVRILAFALILPAIAYGQQAKTSSKLVRFHLVSEPREGAFTMLIPDGWSTQGGVYRKDPSRSGGAGNAVAAKVDFIVTRDAAGTAMMHRLPDTSYKDMRNSPAAGMFPPGSNYGGMVVSPSMDALSYLLNVVLRQTRPQARNLQVVAKVPLPKVASGYDQFDRSIGLPAGFQTNNTALAVVTYDEGGTHYEEVLYTDVLVSGMGTGVWGVKDTYTARAPASEFAALRPVFQLMNDSTKLNKQWIERELASQSARTKVSSDVQQHNQQVDAEIVRHRQQTNAEINGQMQLLLSDKTTEIDPHTGKKTIAPIYDDQGRQGRVFYGKDGTAVLATDPYWDPEKDPNFANKGYRKAQQ
jgi:hypothetical protein